MPVPTSLEWRDIEALFLVLGARTVEGSGSRVRFELMGVDDRLDYGETRWVTLGVLHGKVVVIVHTESEDEIHVISMREADKDEQLLFFRNL